MTDVALGVACVRVAADPGGVGRVLLEARHVAIAGQARAGRTAAVTVLAADVAIDATPLRWLADLHAGRRVDVAQTAAAVTAAVAHRAVDAGAAVRATGHRVRAQAQRAGRADLADAAAALGVARAGVSVMGAPRRRPARAVRVAERRAALGAAAARVAVGLAGGAERCA